MRPWVGSYLLESTSLTTEVTNRLMNYDPRSSTFHVLHDQLSDVVLVGLNRATAASMRVILDDYKVRKLSLSDIDQIIDAFMGLLFESLIPFSANFIKINEYAMQHESLSALRVLYVKYKESFTCEQYAFLAKMIIKIYPNERVSTWFSGE